MVEDDLFEAWVFSPDGSTLAEWLEHRRVRELQRVPVLGLEQQRRMAAYQEALAAQMQNRPRGVLGQANSQQGILGFGPGAIGGILGGALKW